MMNILKTQLFLTLFTWPIWFKQAKLVDSLGKPTLKNTFAAVSSNLEVGVRMGLYIKEGKRKSAQYRLSDTFFESRQMKHIRFLPSAAGVATAKARAKRLAKVQT